MLCTTRKKVANQTYVPPLEPCNTRLGKTQSSKKTPETRIPRNFSFESDILRKWCNQPDIMMREIDMSTWIFFYILRYRRNSPWSDIAENRVHPYGIRMSFF